MDNLVNTLADTNAVAGRGTVTYENGKLNAPDNIIMTPTAARTYYLNYRQSHIERIKLYAAIEGLIAGNPPYDPQKLAAAGLQHIANVNTLDAKGLFERAALTFWNLVNQTENLVRFTIRPMQMQQDADYTNWAEIMSRNWTKVVKEQWEDFIPEMCMLTGQLVKYGLSPVVWSDELDFRWSTVDVSRFFVADETPVTTSKWDCVCFESTFTMQYLYSVYVNLPDGAAESWNKEALAQFILRRANTSMKSHNTQGFENFLDIQSAIQNGSFNHGAVFTDSVRLVSLLYKEYSGKISHYIFDPRGEAGDEFLFKMPEQYQEFSEAIVLFTYSPGEFKIHGNRGVGHKIFPACQALMQLDCHMLDMAKMSATPIVKSVSTVGRDVAPIRFIPGVATDVGQAEFVQNQLGANLGGVVNVAQYMEQKVNKNAVIGGDDPGIPDQDRGSKSAPEIQIQSIKEFGVGKNNIAHFYKTLDIVFRNMTAKMLHSRQADPGYDIALEWKELCMEEGVPEEIFETKDASRNKLPRHLSVRASRVAGDGSNLGLIMGLNGIGGVAGGFGAKGQFNYRKDIITARLGVDYADRYLSDSQEPDESAGGASLAALENIAIRQGESPQATQDNQHKAHIASHMAVIMQTIQAIQAQKMDPQEADKIFSLSIQHTQDHLNFIANDPLMEPFMKQISQPWRQINKFAQLNRVKAQKMMQAEVRRRAEEEQQMNADMMEQQRKDAVAQREETRKDFKVQSQVERAKEASRTRAENMKRATEAKAENDRLAIRLKADNERSSMPTIRKPEEILADRTTPDMQNTLEAQVGRTPNPADFE
jgi:hypothetical protein